VEQKVPRSNNRHQRSKSTKYQEATKGIKELKVSRSNKRLYQEARGIKGQTTKDIKGQKTI
jgi:hypothetical protein